MNIAHLHLAINHIPIVGSLFALLLLVCGTWMKNWEWQKAGHLFFVFIALATIPVFLTGEPAEEQIEDLPGFSEALVHEHEEAAEFTLILIEILGAASLLCLFLKSLNETLYRNLNILVLILGAASLAAAGRTANLGGLIRHTEIRENATELPAIMPTDEPQSVKKN